MSKHADTTCMYSVVSIHFSATRNGSNEYTSLYETTVGPLPQRTQGLFEQQNLCLDAMMDLSERDLLCNVATDVLELVADRFKHGNYASHMGLGLLHWRIEY